MADNKDCPAEEVQQQRENPSNTQEKDLSKPSQPSEDTDKSNADHPADKSPHTLKDTAGEHSGTTVNLVLLGLTGAGKSASGNTILSASGNTVLGNKKFESRVSSKPVTKECKEAEIEIKGTHVRVIDTPDIFDDEIDSSVKDKHVTQCKQLCQSDPCVYLLVMHVSRFTDGERDILTKLEEAFGSKAHKHTVILFTRGDDLKQAEMNLEEFLHSCQPDLKNIVERCDKRCVVFENRDSDSHQVEELMETVNKRLEKPQK